MLRLDHSARDGKLASAVIAALTGYGLSCAGRDVVCRRRLAPR
jgi:hypothetical protein